MQVDDRRARLNDSLSPIASPAITLTLTKPSAEVALGIFALGIS